MIRLNHAMALMVDTSSYVCNGYIVFSVEFVAAFPKFNLIIHDHYHQSHQRRYHTYFRHRLRLTA
jgi:hypothetical protein